MLFMIMKQSLIIVWLYQYWGSFPWIGTFLGQKWKLAGSVLIIEGGRLIFHIWGPTMSKDLLSSVAELLIWVRAYQEYVRCLWKAGLMLLDLGETWKWVSKFCSLFFGGCTKKRSNVVVFSFVVYDFSSCVDDTLKLLKAMGRETFQSWPD